MMMKWGKKGNLINHVFPISWLKKLKRKGGSFQPGTKQAKHKAKVPEITRCSSMPTRWKEGRFYSGSDDPYWRLSFGEDNLEEKKGRDVRSMRYSSDDELNVPKSISKSSRSRSFGGNRLRLNETLPEINIITENQCGLKGSKAREERLEPTTESARKDQEQRSFNRGVLKEKKSDVDKRSFEKQHQEDVYETKQLKTVKLRDELQKSGVHDHRRQRNLLCPSCSARISKEDCMFDDSGMEDANAYPEQEFSSEMQNLELKKISETITKNKHHRLSLQLHLSRPVSIKGRKPNRKVNSPTRRNVAKAEYKTREAEFMEKEKRVKRITKDIDMGAEAKTAFDSYAVQKSSYDPRQDFRDSMLEMIIEKGLKQPEELEELLVCYLAQNCDEYHDLIIKVFRQVWFDLNQVYIAATW